MRILLVEDEEKVRRFIIRGLKSEGYIVDEAADGKIGLDLAEHYDYDLIILDVMLPHLNGTQLLKRIRIRNDRVPVIMLTAKDAISEKVEHFNAGANDYITKPFAFAELQVRIKALLKRNTINNNNVIKIGKLEINRLSRQIRIGGKRVEFSAKEYSLLEYLASNPDRVLSRTMIIEHVWDQSFEGLTNIVDVYIRQLRRKIDDEQEYKLIRTIRGMGYCLSNEGNK
jgi:DNA-binding response OmpR family regulator